MAKQQNGRKARPDTRDYPKVRRAMVQAAARLMEGDGYRKFRFEQLAESLDCNRATIYRYFDSKQDLVTEVMLMLMQEITQDIIRQTANGGVNRSKFTDALFEIVRKLRTDRRYAMIMDAGNIETFARLTRDHFSAITTTMLDKFLVANPAGPILKEGISVSEVAPWLIHQIVSYGFLGVPGETDRLQKAYLEKMVVSVIV